MRPLPILALACAAALPAVASAQSPPKIPAAADIPRLDAVNQWRKYQVGCWNPLGCVSPKQGVVFNAIGPLASENDLFDGVSYNGFSQFVAERYDYAGGHWTGVGPHEVVGGFYGAAQMDTGSDPVDAGMMLYTTEAQSRGHNGMGLELDYTADGSTALARGVSVSPQGKGGVTIGGGYAQNNPYKYKGVADLGPGTLHVASDITTAGHFRSDGKAPTLSACGARPSVTGTDAAGAVATGGPVSSCTINFAKAYAAPPICIVQTFARSTPAAYVSSYTAASLTVRWDRPLDGRFFYICQEGS